MAATVNEIETQIGDDSKAQPRLQETSSNELTRDRAWREVDPALYDFGAEISSGGLGRVVAAQDRRLRRKVAIKQLRARGGQVDERFRREAQITARLQHPSIVPIYEAGRWPNGEPFYAMKLVSGRTLGELIRAAPDLSARLALLPVVFRAAEAVAYAHSQRVIHRDLKPLNIMAGDFGEALVIDWGLAKELDATGEESPGSSSAKPPPSELAADSSLTRAGAILGTPSFMSPEQARGEPADPRSDVYALGAVLYCTLCGSEPFEGTPREMMEATSSRSPRSVVEREPGAPRELVAIVEKAMAHDPSQRYPDAGALVEDLHLFETGQLVRAHRYSTAALARRWVALHRGAVALVVGALLGLAGMLTTAVISARRIIRERDAARLARADAERRGSELLLTQAKLLVEKRPTEAVAALKQYAGGERTDWRAVASLVAEARSRVISRHVFSALPKPLLSDDGQGAAWVEGEEIRVLDLERSIARSFPLSGGGALFAFGRAGLLAWSRAGGELLAIDLERGSKRAVGRFDAEPKAATMTADGRRFAAAEAGGAIVLFEGGQPVRRLEPREGEVWRLSFSPDGTWLFSHGLDRAARLIRASDGQVKATFSRPVIHDWAFSSDSRLLALSTSDAAPRVLDLLGGPERELAGHQESTGGIAFSPDGKTLYSGSADQTIREWDLATARGRVLAGHEGLVEKLAVSPSGRFLASASADQTVRVWDLPLGESAILRGHDDYVRSMVFSPDERRLITADGSGQVRVWDLPPPPRLLPASGVVEDLGSSVDGALFAQSSGELRVFSEQDGAVLASLRARGLQRPIAVAPGGSAFAAVGEAGAILVWRRGEASPRVLSGSQGRVNALAMSSDGRWLASSGDDRLVRVWDVEAGSVLRRFEGHRAPVWVLAFSPDGKLLASAGDDDELRVWTLESGEARRYPSKDLVYSVAFSPDSQRLAWTGGGAAGSLLAVPSGETAALQGHTAAIRPISFSPDGIHIATGADDRTTRIWTLPSLASTALADDAPVRLVQFSPDGRLLLTATDRTARLWDVERAAQLFCVRGTREINMTTITADGRWMAVAFNGSPFVRLWPTALESGPSDRGWLERLTSVRMGAGDRASSPLP
jgi:WD40 repeat protein